jgi:RNA polymerase sigma factor (sigma-70 family)
LNAVMAHRRLMERGAMAALVGVAGQPWWLAAQTEVPATGASWTGRTDAELVASARHGRPDAYGELVRRYQQVVYNVALRQTGDRQEALDLAQETFVRAYRLLGSFDQTRPFGPWIARVAVHVAVSAYQRRPAPTVPLVVTHDSERILPDPAPGPEQQALAAERSASLRRAIALLPPHYRAVIELRHFQELTYEEIAAALGIPLSGVKSHLFRARRRLRETLDGSQV